MSNCITKQFEFPYVKGHQVFANFKGGSVSSDAGLLLLSLADKQLGLLKAVAKAIPDKRDPSKVQHSIEDMLRQRVFGICLGYEDLNDHQSLRSDVAFQTSVGTDETLASSSTLCRFENKANREMAFDIHKVIVDQFVASFKKPPKELILDFDSTDDLVHGNQIGRFFHGYYGNYCFLPLYVFCGQKLLVAYLRQANQDGATHAAAILKLLVIRLRIAWPDVRIIFRADSGFCRQTILNWCDRKKVYYIVGIARNKVLEKRLSPLMAISKNQFDISGQKQRFFTEFIYGAGSWIRPRKIIGKAEYSSDGANPRFIVTNLDGDPQALYDEVYCARGDMENRIKEQQLYLFADRTSCHEWYANQFRLLMASLAYIILEYIREKGLVGTELECARVDTIRLKLLKIGAVITKNTRRICFMLSSHYPYQSLFAQVYEKLTPT